MSLEKYVLSGNPVCSPECVIQGPKFRISVLTTALLRFEYAEDGKFEDRISQMVVCRDFPVPEFRVIEHPEELVIFTKDAEIHYDRGAFTPAGLMIRVAGGRNNERVWHYGEEPKDLRGTARTLDEADGAIPLERGILSRNGFSVLDDSHTMILREDGTVEPRSAGKTDFYFFAYGHRYLECLKDFYRLCGQTPLLPRYVFGNWWSRYYRYTDSEYRQLIERFEREKLPFTLAVIDMDWHLVDDVDPKYGSGWTGYTWNRKFFPDPAAFMSWLHDHGMKVTLNVHPADGIRGFEEAYPAVAEKMGIDPASEEPVLFDFLNEKFVETYFEDVHHPMEKDGVDFWWLDWQQGTVTKVPGLDPLWMLNHYHYLDSRWKGTRPLTFSRYAGPGSHRYPIGFSGDTLITWESLQFQPYFTANASNIGYGWWSHDIGGHMRGGRDDELNCRWVQLGVFSPINRLHSSDNPFSGKEPWKYDRIVEENMKEFLTLRHALIPYLYTMNRLASRDGLPLVQPMYYQEPEREECYHVPNNYYFGTEMMVSPITEPVQRSSRMAGAVTWIPEGTWFDFFTGREYRGGRLMELWRPLSEMPVLVRAGGIVPMTDMTEFSNSVENPQSMEIRIYPGADRSFTLWEDAGDTPEDLDENWAFTEMKQSFTDEKTVFVIDAARGNLSVLPERRDWKLRFYRMRGAEVRIMVDGCEIQPGIALEAAELHAERNTERRFERSITHDFERNTVQIFYSVTEQDDISGVEIQISSVPVGSTVKVELSGGSGNSDSDMLRDLYALIERAQVSYDQKLSLWNLLKEQKKNAVASLLTMELDRDLLGAICEILLAS